VQYRSATSFPESTAFVPGTPILSNPIWLKMADCSQAAGCIRAHMMLMVEAAKMAELRAAASARRHEAGQPTGRRDSLEATGLALLSARDLLCD
jgi:hypothetical protein